jgi:hypothetical protein
MRMDHDHARQLLSASHPRMAALIARSRRYEIQPAVSIRPFDALAESIAYKQNRSIRKKSSRHRTKDFAPLAFRVRKLPH